MWLVLARWGGTVSGRQSAVLSHRPVQELSGHLCTAVKGLAFLEGEEEGGTPTISLAFFFSFWPKLYWQKTWHSSCQCWDFTYLSSDHAPLYVWGVCTRICVCHK